jgi:hypothetical protein
MPATNVAGERQSIRANHHLEKPMAQAPACSISL